MPFPLSSRSVVLVALACLFATLTGCHSKSVITPAECVGTYEYRFLDKPQGTACFTLHSDGTYILGKEQGQQEGLAFFRLKPMGLWHINDDYARQQLFIDQVTVPLTRVNGSIRLRMNLDYNISCDLLPGTNKHL